MLHPDPGHDLTYNDVFMVPSLSEVASRLDVDLSTPDGLGTHIPVVVSNMTAVAGRRMAETVARRGGLTVLPQDIPLDVIASVVDYVKSRHPVYETPITLSPHDTIGDAVNLVHKRAHGAVVVVDDDERPIGLFAEADAAGFDRFTQLHAVMSREFDTVVDGTESAAIFEQLSHQRNATAPVVDHDGRLLGVMTRQGALRSTIYKPAVDRNGALMLAVAVGINGEPADRAKRLAELGVDVLVIDTAHGHQTTNARRRRGSAQPGVGRPDRRRQRRHGRWNATAPRRRRRHREGRCRAGSDVHHTDDDGRRQAAVLRRGGMLG